MEYFYLDPGELRHRLNLRENSPVEDGHGGFESVWTNVSEHWVRIMPARAGYSVRAEINAADYTHIIDMRQPVPAMAGMQFSAADNSRTFSVLASYDPDETGRYLRCICRQEKAGQ